jgi:hypothetical protein
MRIGTGFSRALRPRASAADPPRDSPRRVSVPRSVASGSMRARRQALGLSPTVLRNSRLRWAWSARPQSSAIRLSGASVDSMSAWARSMRRRMTYSRGELPKLSRNVRLKWHGLSRTSAASSALRIGLSRLASTCIVTLRICQGARPPRTRRCAGAPGRSAPRRIAAARRRHASAASRSSSSVQSSAAYSASTAARIEGDPPPASDSSARDDAAPRFTPPPAIASIEPPVRLGGRARVARFSCG